MADLLTQLHWGALFQIVMIDILLGGDNAVVIALACRRLDRRRRTQGIIWGTFGAVALRVVLIAFALTLLDIPWLKLAGGLLLLWIGIKLMLPDDLHHEGIRGGDTLWTAVRTIILADLVMSLDNVLAIAGAAQYAIPDHRLAYVIFGLLLSVPIIVWGSTMVLRLIDAFPFIVVLGAGLLGWIAGGMIITDPAVLALFAEPVQGGRLLAELLGAIAVVGTGWLMVRMRRPRPQDGENP